MAPWSRFRLGARRAAPVVALDWTDQHWVAAWIQPANLQRVYVTQPIDVATPGSPSDRPDADAVSEVRHWLQAHVGRPQAVVMALPASAVDQTWVWAPLTVDLSDINALETSMPTVWADAGWTFVPAQHQTRHVDVAPVRAETRPGQVHETPVSDEGQWWVAAAPEVVAQFEAWCDELGAPLKALDVRAAALARAVQARHRGEWPVLLVDDHCGQTQWLIVEPSGVRGVQSFDHRRLSSAEHRDHALTQLQAALAELTSAVCLCTGEAASWMAPVAAALGLEVRPSLTEDPDISVCTAMVDGLLDGWAERR